MYAERSRSIKPPKEPDHPTQLCFLPHILDLAQNLTILHAHTLLERDPRPSDKIL